MLTQNQTIQHGQFSNLTLIENSENSSSYEAFDNTLQTTVIIKEFCGGARHTDQAELLTSLNHKSQVKVHNHFAENDRHYLVMEKPEGLNIAEILESEKSPFFLSEIRVWAEQILEAVKNLHNQKPRVLHRDIRPENLIVNSDGNIKLLLHNIVQDSVLNSSTVSADEQFNPADLAFAPLEEVWESLDLASRHAILNSFDEESQKSLAKPVDIRGDLYSIGATFYYMATARVPYDALTRLIDIMDGNDDPLLPPNTLNPTIPKAVSDVIMGALEIKRENRYSSAVIMQRILRTALSISAKSEADLNTELASNNIPHANVNITPPIITNQATAETSAKHVKEQLSQQPKTQSNTPHSPAKTDVTGVATPKVPEILIDKLKKTEKPITELPVTQKEFESEQIQQLELIKEQLREAELRRLAAEKLVAKAELLLQEQNQKQERFAPVNQNLSEYEKDADIEVKKELVSPELETTTNLNLTNTSERNSEATEPSESDSLDRDSEKLKSSRNEQELCAGVSMSTSILRKKKSEDNTNPNLNADDNLELPTDDYKPERVANDNESDEIFSQKNIETSQKKVSSMKMVAGALGLLLISGAVFGIYQYTSLLSNRANEATIDNIQPIITKQPKLEENFVPLAENLVETNEVSKDDETEVFTELPNSNEEPTESANAEVQPKKPVRHNE